MSSSDNSAQVIQTVVQINIYRFCNNRFEYLLLKRIDRETKFWQPVTLPVPGHGTIAETLRRAAKEQVGISGFKHLSSEMYSYDWYAHGQQGRDIVFAAEVSPQTNISHDTASFNDHAWLPANEAIAALKWNGNKQALRQLDGHLAAEYQQHPGPFQSAQRASSQPLQSLHSVQPADDRTTLVPPSASSRQRRLPDQPGIKPRHDEDEPTIGELFLRM